MRWAVACSGMLCTSWNSATYRQSVEHVYVLAKLSGAGQRKFGKIKAFFNALLASSPFALQYIFAMSAESAVSLAKGSTLSNAISCVLISNSLNGGGKTNKRCAFVKDAMLLPSWEARCGCIKNRYRFSSNPNVACCMLKES